MREIQGIVIENGVKIKRKMVIEDRECSICGTLYEPYTQDATCCSKKCYRAAEYKRKREDILKQRKASYLKNKDKVLERSKKYYLQHRKETKVRTRKYYLANRQTFLDNVAAYADKVRHGGKRKELIALHGYVCYLCNKTSKIIAAHHVTLDKTDHENQILLCSSCHSKLHWLIKKQNI